MYVSHNPVKHKDNGRVWQWWTNEGIKVKRETLVCSNRSSEVKACTVLNQWTLLFIRLNHIRFIWNVSSVWLFGRSGVMAREQLLISRTSLSVVFSEIKGKWALFISGLLHRSRWLVSPHSTELLTLSLKEILVPRSPSISTHWHLRGWRGYCVKVETRFQLTSDVSFGGGHYKPQDSTQSLFSPSPLQYEQLFSSCDVL